MRPKQTNCQQEPPYPEHDTIVFSIRNPDLTVHGKSDKCPYEAPHRLEECGHITGLGTPIPRCQKCGKWANRRDIDGDWWPPCGCGIQFMKYADEGLP